ncbi:hypothetical protein C8A00DRAFT_10977 [Chaetomidium leptoderma]|uniref:Zn(2)-C6 fungal-type domain-containing protein n=1 Tax=Chaetomidium leptoderma TaxID=669021 RepID=A0AAN6VXE0_9PEZI|nr:hypothetical protein C8A00DRAFT_10977 [Chaetomidium leptoderma]
MSTPGSNDGGGDTPADSHHALQPAGNPRHFRPRACQNCAQSKLRCEWPVESGAGASVCIRCAKTSASCVLPPLTDRKRRGPSTRVRKLEDKAEGLMSLLRAGERVPPLPKDKPHAGDTQDPSGSQRQQQYSPSPSSMATPHPPAVPAGSIQIVPGFVLSLAEADAIINIYRTSYSPYFPFVPIPVTVAATELEETAPFLLRTILQVAVPQIAVVQKSVDRWFRQVMAQRSQATDLLHMASTLVLDLGLHKAPNQYGAGRQSFLPDAIRKIKGSAKYGHTLDDMRAMLGFRYLNSVVSALFQRTGKAMHTPYVSHCCDVLLSAQEHDSDKFLVALVRMQQLGARVADALPSPETDDSPQSMNGSVYMMMTTAQKELDALARSQPPEVQRNVLLWTQYHGVLIRLFEPALSIRPAPRSHDASKSTARTDALSSCLQACMDFFAAYTSIPIDSLGYMPLVATAYMAFAFVTASRILMLNDADWNVGVARRSLDFSATCQTLSDRFRQADGLAESLGRRRKIKDDEAGSVLGAYSLKIRWIRQWYLAKISAAGTVAPGVGGDNRKVPVSSGMDIDPLVSSRSTSLHMIQELDDDFWNALLDPKDGYS